MFGLEDYMNVKNDWFDRWQIPLVQIVNRGNFTDFGGNW